MANYINSYVKQLFGGAADGNQTARALAGQNQQLIAELVTATTSRVMHGPQRNGHFSLHIINNAGTVPVGNLTVWYSNLVNPDPTNDAHWVQDTAIIAVDLSLAANTFVNVGNVNAQHIRLKVTRTSGTISLVVWVRAEGVEV